MLKACSMHINTRGLHNSCQEIDGVVTTVATQMEAQSKSIERIHKYIHFTLLKQDNKHSRTHLGENMKKIQNKRK